MAYSHILRTELVLMKINKRLVPIVPALDEPDHVVINVPNIV